MDKKRPVVKEDAKTIHGSYDKYGDWNMDPKGYLLIRINKEDGRIEAGLCQKDNIVEFLITGKIPQEIYYEFARRNLLNRPEHYAYLGKELEKAYMALKHGLDYVQDEELNM